MKPEECFQGDILVLKDKRWNRDLRMKIRYICFKNRRISMTFLNAETMTIAAKSDATEYLNSWLPALRDLWTEFNFET